VEVEAGARATGDVRAEVAAEEVCQRIALMCPRSYFRSSIPHSFIAYRLTPRPLRSAHLADKRKSGGYGGENAAKKARSD
jgi:hypothetical protein